MLRKLSSLVLVVLLIAGNAYAVPPDYAIPMPALTPLNKPTPGNAGSAAVDQFGNVQIGAIVPGTGATNLGKAEDAVHADGDTGVMALGVVNNSFVAREGASGDYGVISTTDKGAVHVLIDRQSQVTNDSALLKPEDTAAASGDALVGVAGVSNIAQTIFAADGDYVPIGTDRAGSVAIRGFKSEDAASASGDDLISVGGIAQSTVGSPASSGDYANFALDLGGRTITTLAPAGETWSACSGAATTTADTAIKAAVASNRIYVTDIDCNNFSAVPSRVSIKDGSTVIYQGVTAQGVATASIWSHTFMIPLRGTVNTALNFAMGTTSTSTICCASGYISVN
jgi:hypothetical protein